MLRSSKRKDPPKERTIGVVDQETELEEHISLLSSEDRAAVERVTKDVGTTIVEAAKESVRQIKLVEEGRCPECGQKTHCFLFTTICEHCGWFVFIRPKKSRTIVHMSDGNEVVCQELFSTPTELLCVTDDVVRYRVVRENVGHVEFDWSEEEIQERKDQLAREETTVCCWCEREMDRGVKETCVTFVAFGRQQDRFFYCSENCQRSFQKQYPTRIHRNCYSRECDDCDECVRKFDDTSYEVFLDKID